MNNRSFDFERKSIFSGYDGKTCKTCPRIATDGNVTFMTWYMLLLTGSDVFYDTYITKSTDGGKTFSEPKIAKNFQTEENGMRRVTNGWLSYSRYNKKWFAIGQELLYADDKEQVLINDQGTCNPMQFSFSPENEDFDEVRPLPFPFEYISATPRPEYFEYENGDILIPFYFIPKGKDIAQVVTVKYGFKDGFLEMKEHGEPVYTEGHRRGLQEPAVTKCKDKYYMTLRTDEIGLFSISDDGFKFSEPAPIVWENGEEIGNYNTMTHWISHNGELYLTYTRRGAHNDHVFRHRAPIFMARFDTERNCLLRDTEIILVPELGTRLGNFTITEMNESRTTLVTAEWMQPKGCEKYGSNNSIWLADILWNKEEKG